MKGIGAATDERMEVREFGAKLPGRELLLGGVTSASVIAIFTGEMEVRV